MSTDVVLMLGLKAIVAYTYLNEVFLWSKRIGFESLDLVERNMMMDRKKENGTMNSDIFYVEQDVSSWMDGC